MPQERAEAPRPLRRTAATTAAIGGLNTTATSTTADNSRSHSPASTSSSSTTALLQGPFQQQVRRYDDENVRALMHTLPSSPKQLLRRLEEQQHEVHLLREENIRLKSREVDVSALALRLQERISATQNQVDHIKAQVQLQLSNPITDDEYHRIEALPEAERDLVDAMKLGIHRQLASLRASQQAALKRAAELSSVVARLQQENADMKVRLAELETQSTSEKDKGEQKMRQLASQQARITELEGHLASLESKSKSLYVDQEQYLSAKLTAQVKTDEVARLAVRLEEAEMDTQRYRANAECTEQKLDILKSEYYELKLRYGQRVLELESALKASEEKLKTLGDLEMESELFISNLAASSQGEIAFSTDITEGAGSGGRHGTANAYESWLALPRSRKLAHSLVVTKRCLHLENKVAALEHELEFKQTQMARLQVALDGARDALHNINSPYVLVEKAMTELTDANESLKQKVRILEQDKKDLQQKLQQCAGNLRVLTHHRKELLRIKKMLRQLGLREGFVLPTAEDDEADGEADARRPRAQRRTSSPTDAQTPPPRASRASSAGAAAARRVDGAEAGEDGAYRIPGNTPSASYGSLKPIEMQF